MPTGYTQDVMDGKITTLKEFALHCARAFNATVSMRDDSLDSSIPEEFKPNTHSLEKRNELLREYIDRTNWTLDRWAQEQEIKIDETTKGNEAVIEHSKKLKLKYYNMLSQVLTWNPPTEEHQSLKEFMIKQLQDSIKWDCTPYIVVPERLSPEEYKQDKMDSIIKNIKYYEKSYREEVERTDSRNKWIKELRESLK